MFSRSLLSTKKAVLFTRAGVRTEKKVHDASGGGFKKNKGDKKDKNQLEEVTERVKMSDWDQLYWSFRLNRDLRKHMKFSQFKTPQQMENEKIQTLAYSKAKLENEKKIIWDVQKKLKLVWAAVDELPIEFQAAAKEQDNNYESLQNLWVPTWEVPPTFPAKKWI